jgi:hypothetical protein
MLIASASRHQARRLISIRDGTAPGGGDSVADPTMAPDRSADGASVRQLASWWADVVQVDGGFGVGQGG